VSICCPSGKKNRGGDGSVRKGGIYREFELSRGCNSELPAEDVFNEYEEKKRREGVGVGVEEILLGETLEKEKKGGNEIFYAPDARFYDSQ